MHKKQVLTFYFWFLGFLAGAQSLQSPSDFLGYELGTAFTYHHDMLDYFEHVAEKSDMVKLETYGKTYERRKLIAAFISSKKNLDRLDEIRQNNLIAAGLAEGAIQGEQLPIVWLSYNIHGNEAAGMEAAIKVLYDLVSDKVPNGATWLDQVVVVIDPCENPDGRDRYANWYNQKMNRKANANYDSWDHREPWPNGRPNHYCFDLNRDWAWQTQIESQFRTKLYQQWMPQVHVDLHEMGPNNPYFFGPSAAPFHQTITSWQREFHRLSGKNHAKYFDQEGWLYFTNETFDLLYPSYGDTWPTFNGAIGFTYEQGGSGAGGLAIKTSIGDTLTLHDRLIHHYTASLSTIELTYTHKDRLLDEFRKYFKSGMANPVGAYAAYVIKGSTNTKTLQAVLALLDKQGIAYGYPVMERKTEMSGYSYFDKSIKSFKLAENDIVVSAYQPKHHMVRVLFDPDPELSDSMTYDMTAWALPYIYGVESYGVKTKIGVSDKEVSFEKVINKQADSTYVFFARWNDVKDVQFLGDLISNGLNVRYAERPFKINGASFERGTLMIAKADNKRKTDFVSRLTAIANKHQKPLITSKTGLVEEGKDLGSSYWNFIGKPKVALIAGQGVSSTSFGEVWHYFEQVIEYPATVLHTDYLSGVSLEKFDVIVLPSGSYHKYNSKLESFVRKGGRLIALDRAITSLKGTKLHDAKQDYDAEHSEATPQGEALLKSYEDRNRRQLSSDVAGSISKVYLDETHPLAFGVSKNFYLAKRNSNLYPYLTSGWNVGVYKDDSHVAGFMGYKLKKKLPSTLAMGVERLGSGEVVYFPDSPTFRGFWYSGQLVMGNAIFFVGR
ncbi:MAG: M14 family metallopeptidase [Flammeovirgaceae bacterium]